MGHLWFIMGGAFMTMCEHYGLDGWGSYDKVSCCFFWKYAKKNVGLQGSSLSDHRMTTGFGSFELPTCRLLQRGGDHSLFLFEEPSSWLAFTVHVL